MSDPAPAGGRGNSGAAGPAIGLVLAAALWFLFGYGLADVFRYPIGVLYLPPAAQPPHGSPQLLWALFAGAFGGAIAGIVTQRRLVNALGAVGGIAALISAALVGMAFGILFGARADWVAPAEQGRFAGAADRAGEVWGAGAWIAWTSRLWLPGVLILIALMLFAVTVRAMSTRRRGLARARNLIETGRKARGVVIESAETGIEILGRARVRYTVRFADHLGDEQLVTKTGAFHRTGIPQLGGHAVVWFDPEDPGDHRSLPVGFGSRAEVKRVLSGKGSLDPQL